MYRTRVYHKMRSLGWTSSLIGYLTTLYAMRGSFSTKWEDAERYLLSGSAYISMCRGLMVVSTTAQAPPRNSPFGGMYIRIGWLYSRNPSTMYAPNFNICSYISAKIIPHTLSMLQNKIAPKDLHGTIMLHLLQA